MKQSILKQLSLYNYRYVVGYVFYAVLLTLLLLLSITDLPRGLSTAEMTSVTHSASTSVQAILLNSPIDAPYALLQKVSLHFFGITTFSIKLPSLILAFTTGMALIFMLRQWFSDNVAVLTSITVASAGPFMTMGRTGTAMILYAFWLSIILLAATKKLYGKERTFKWKLLFFAAAAGSLYTPMMIYPLISIAAAGMFHPHIRFAIRRVSLKKLGIVISVALLILAPLIWAIIKDPSLLITLLGWPQAIPTLATIQANLFTFIRIFFDFGNVQIGTYMLPLFNAATMVIVLLGFLQTLVDRHSARSYMLLIWSSLIFLLILFNPAAVTVLYIPIILYLAVGVETLIREWYRL
ncbi:glycosyltransferase family 39 protein, partial [Pedobacter sp.]|nr:glycosyltransferase family 39 protein [Candidatus Saccharibacteria bacterium]